MSAQKAATVGQCLQARRPSFEVVPPVAGTQAHDTTPGLLDDLPAILTLEQAAEVLQLGITTTRGMCRTGELPAFKLGQQWRIPRAWLENFIVGGGDAL